MRYPSVPDAVFSQGELDSSCVGPRGIDAKFEFKWRTEWRVIGATGRRGWPARVRCVAAAEICH
jgi:hypothetical protein